jgi:hypothetical protein
MGILSQLPTRSLQNNLEHLKKYGSHLERGFVVFGEATAKEQVSKNPVTEPKRSQKPKRPLLLNLFAEWRPNF